MTTALTVTLIVILAQGSIVQNAAVEQVCMLDECVTSAGYLSNSMDLSVDPCDDFYKFTCGKWQDDHPFPANVDGWSHFYKLAYDMRKYIKKDLENMTLDKIKLNAYKKLYNFYHGCINETSRNSTGYVGLKTKIGELGGWPTIDPDWTDSQYDWQESLIQSSKLKHFPLITIQANKDMMENNETIMTIGPSSNAEEDFYELSRIFQDKRTTTKSQYYDMSESARILIRKLTLEITKEDRLTNSTHLSSDQMDKDFLDMKDLYQKLRSGLSTMRTVSYYMKNYKNSKFTVAQLNSQYPQINFTRILNGVFNTEVNEDTLIFIWDIKYLDNLAQAINATDKRTIANYFATSFAIRFGRYTTTNMVNLLVDTLDEPEVLPNICYDLTETYLPNLLGRLYVDKHFNQTWKEGMKEIIDLIHKTFLESLNDTQSNWMDSVTKLEAIKKVENIQKNIAYPDWTKNNTELDTYYSDVTIQIDDFFSSVLSVIQAKMNENINMLQMISNSEIDTDPNHANRVKDSWPSHDATYVNAFYYFSTNGIYFPAGIAQYPFFMYGRPMAMNLGSSGAIIGHEMTHSLDNQGRLYDYKGDLRDWWRNDTRDAFLQKSQCFIDQYSRFYFPEYKMNVSGIRTLAENIADNGGIRQAFRALRTYQEQRTKPFIPLPGKMQKFTEEQLFFISYANMWCSNMNSNATLDGLKVNVHAPETIRVNGTLANFDEFSRAFKCKETSKMNPKNKCILW